MELPGIGSFQSYDSKQIRQLCRWYLQTSSLEWNRQIHWNPINCFPAVVNDMVLILLDICGQCSQKAELHAAYLIPPRSQITLNDSSIRLRASAVSPYFSEIPLLKALVTNKPSDLQESSRGKKQISSRQNALSFKPFGDLSSIFFR